MTMMKNRWSTIFNMNQPIMGQKNSDTMLCKNDRVSYPTFGCMLFILALGAGDPYLGINSYYGYINEAK